MATITATITVDFTAQYAGDHRACFRIQGSGDPYDCTTIVNCTGGGAACQAVITTDVNDTSCDGVVTFEGYIQSTCETEASINGRLDFTADFTPDVDCHREEITCDYAGISAINITDNGKDFTPAAVVTITRDVGDTQTSDATFTLGLPGTGVINSITGLTAAGSGYVALDVLTIAGSEGGVGGQITVNTVGGSGEILTFTLTAGGSLYQGVISVTGGTGVGAAFDILPFGVDFDEFGAITSIAVTTPGLYDIAPAVSITGVGSDFAGTVSLANCGALAAIGLDCAGGPLALAAGVPHGTSWAVCVDDAGLTLPADYSSVEAGCCITADSVNDSCYTYNINNTSGGAVTVQYMTCDTGISTSVIVNDATDVDICAVIGSVEDQGTAGVAITTANVTC